MLCLDSQNHKIWTQNMVGHTRTGRDILCPKIVWCKDSTVPNRATLGKELEALHYNICFKTSHDPIKYLQVNGPIHGRAAASRGRTEGRRYRAPSQVPISRLPFRRAPSEVPRAGNCGWRAAASASGLRVASGSVGDVAPRARSAAARPKMVFKKLTMLQ